MKFPFKIVEITCAETCDNRLAYAGWFEDPNEPGVKFLGAIAFQAGNPMASFSGGQVHTLLFRHDGDLPGELAVAANKAGIVPTEHGQPQKRLH